MELDSLTLLNLKNKNIFTVTRSRSNSPNKYPFFWPLPRLGNKISMYKRHDKSLYELSKRFLDRLWDKKDFLINLESMTLELGTNFTAKEYDFFPHFWKRMFANPLDIERRRLYDIINILESLGIIYRVSKSCFMWKGLRKAREHILKVKYFLTPVSPIFHRLEDPHRIRAHGNHQWLHFQRIWKLQPQKKVILRLILAWKEKNLWQFCRSIWSSSFTKMTSCRP